jgi:ADP-heptose:LPS heptosyltransferase
MEFIYKVNNVLAFILFLIIKATCSVFYSRKKKNTGKRILFVNLGLLGDFIISTVLFANEEKYPTREEIYFLTDEKYYPLLGENSTQIKVRAVNKNKYKKNLFYRCSMLKKLLEKNFTEVYNLSFTRVSIDDEISIISAGKEKSYAFENNKNLNRIFNNAFERYYTGILKKQDQNDFNNIVNMLAEIFNAQINKRTKVFVKGNKPDIILGHYFVVSPFSSSTIKEWGIKNYEKLAKKIISKYNLTCVILNEKPEQTLLDDFSEVLNLTGKTNIAEVAAIIKNASFFVGNDSGLLHLAKAAGVMSFGIVGGGVWGRIYPYAENGKCEYFYSRKDCFNCDWNCEYAEPYCLTEVKVDEVFEKVKDFIESNE